MKIEIYHEKDGTFTVYAAEQDIPKITNLLLKNGAINITSSEPRAISSTQGSVFSLSSQVTTYMGVVEGKINGAEGDIEAVYAAIEQEFGYRPIKTDLRKQST